jgi:integrase
MVDMASLRKRGVVWYYRFVDEHGVKVERKGCADKRVTEELARDAESAAAKLRSGLVDPKEFAYRDHGARPLAAHLDAYAAHLKDRGLTEAHIGLATGRVRRAVAIFRGAGLGEVEPANSSAAELDRAAARLAGWIAPARLSDLTTDRVQSALRRLREGGRSLATCNQYAAAICAFAKWCYDTHRLREYPLRGVERFNAKEDRRHDRRTISVEDLRRLVEVAHRRPRFNRMSGTACALCYQLAASTGLRHSEIATITPASFNWKAPSVTIKAAYTKNGDPATLPLPGDLARDLAAYVATLAAGSPVFPLAKGEGAEMLRVDLEAADIPYRDAGGLVFDFHSLRCETATLADQAGVSPRVVQKLMRHSTLELTGRYTRPRVVDIEAAASMLPSLKSGGDRPGVQAATGTDGLAHHLAPEEGPTAPEYAGKPGVEGQPISKPFAHHLPTGGDGSVRSSAAQCAMTGSDIRKAMEGKNPENKAQDGSRQSQTAAVANDRGEARTPGQRLTITIALDLGACPVLNGCEPSQPGRTANGPPLLRPSVRL